MWGGAWQGPLGKMGPGRLGIFIMRRWPRIAVCGLFGPIVWGGAWQGPPVGKVSPKRLGFFIMKRGPRIAVCGLLGPIVWGALAKGSSKRIAKAMEGEVGARSATPGEGEVGGSETKAKQSKAEKEGEGGGISNT